MRKNISNLSLLIVILCLIFISCSDPSLGKSTELNTEQFSGFFVEQDVAIDTSILLESYVKNAQYIILCTSTEIGEAFLPDGYIIHDNMTDFELKDIVCEIKTPISFIVDRVIKSPDSMNESLTEGKTLTINASYGTIMDKYRLYPIENSITYENNKKYLLFLTESSGKYYVHAQPSLVFHNDESFFSLMSNNTFYTDCKTQNEIITKISALLP